MLRQTPLIVDTSFVASAMKLEPLDLLGEMFMCVKLMQEGCTQWSKPSLASYGSVLYHEHRERGGNSNVTYLKFFQRQIRGVPEPPDWAAQYIENHKRFLSCVGWVRYLKDRGLADSNIKELLDKDSLMQVVRESNSDNLLDTLKWLESTLKLRKAGVKRTYSDFDPPAIRSLYP